MKFHGTTCKFCKIPITVEIDDDYAALGDPFKLLPLVCCNRCADLRTERRRMESRIQFSLSMFRLSGKRSDADFVAKIRETLTNLTKEYASLISRWHRMDGQLWDAQIVEQLIEKPDHWGDTLGHIWQMFRQWEKEQEQAKLI